MSEVPKLEDYAKGNPNDTDLYFRAMKEWHKEFEDFMQCTRCGDYFDMSNLSRVVVHENCERVQPFRKGERIS